MEQIERAKKLLSSGATFALVSDDEIFSTDRRGIAPLLELAEEGKNLSGFSAADKIVGKAAAMLYCYMEIQEVWAEVMSRAAAAVFEKYGVKYSCANLVDYIINRKGDGMCPMESTVADINSPAEAIRALRAKLNELTAK